MTFFERYFAALDGPDPHSSLELVADELKFSIQWASGTDRASREPPAGATSCEPFIAAAAT